MTKRANHYNTAIAAEYFVLSQLYRQNIEAYISQENKKAIDIRIVTEGKKPISIDVKAVRGYSSLIVNNILHSEDHFIIFVIYNNKFNDVISSYPEVFIVPSTDLVKNKLVNIYKKEKRVLKGNLKNYKDRWDLLH